MIKYFILIWMHLKSAFHRFSNLFDVTPELSLAPKEEAPQAIKANTQLVFAERTYVDNNKSNVVVVEVESFSDHPPYIADLRTATGVKITNYTRDGEDPNLLITHYPPSNRVH
jgi:hypothetical protein